VNIVSIQELFEQCVTGYYVEKKKNSCPDYIWLKIGKTAIARIYSNINQFDDWDEDGNLCFEVIDVNACCYSMISIDKSWLKIKQTCISCCSAKIRYQIYR